jgi:hypothetical protein
LYSNFNSIEKIFINSVPAKSQFLQFNSQQSLAFSRLTAEKDSYCSCVINFVYAIKEWKKIKPFLEHGGIL